jgi:hypothetical protein
MNTENTNKKESEKDVWLRWALVLVAVGGLTSFLPWYLLEKIETNWFRIHLKEYEGFGQFLAGVTTPFFTLAAFILLVKTYQSQKQELQETRKEFATQNETLRLQRFENTFFNMLDLHNDIVDKMRTPSGRIGRSVIDFAKDKLTVFLKERQAASISEADEIIKADYYNAFYRDFEPSLNHYFRQLYHIFKFIYFSDLKTVDKDFYVSIARSTLSQNELYLIAFNAIIRGSGNPKMLWLINQQEILKNFRSGEIPDIYWKLIEQYIDRAEYRFDRPKK